MSKRKDISERDINNVRFKLGKRLYELRNAKGYSLEYLANLCEVNRKHYPLIEKGEIDIRLSTLEKLAIGLEIDLYELLDFNNN